MSRRYKIYAAQTGITYQYFFVACQPVRRPEGLGAGSDFTFVLIADQHPPFTLRVFVSNRALAAWEEAHGRELDAREQYALAKMALFRAFDEQENLRERPRSIAVDEASIEDLAEPLGLA
jgi:hypothetical protein